MNNKQQQNNSSGGGMALNDIYFVLFRNKWKIAILSTMGFLAAAGIYLFTPPSYESDADLYIKYIKRDIPNAFGANDGQTQPLDSGTEGVISAELSILSSFDLAYQVATNVGPAKILGNPNGPNDAAAANAAANRVRGSLIVEHAPRTTVLNLRYVGSDMNLVQPVLQQLVDSYEQRHKEIHSENGTTYEQLAETVGRLHDEMNQTEGELRKAKNDANVNNIDKKRDDNEQLMGQLHQGIFLVKADLADHKTRLAKLQPAKPAAVPAATNSVASTNAQAEVPKEKKERYQQTLDLIGDLRKEYVNLRSFYPLHNKLVIEKQTQIDEQVKIKQAMETEEPRLTETVEATDKTSAPTSTGPSNEQLLKQEEMTVESLQSKLDTLQKAFDETHADSSQLDSRESNIKELERKFKTQQENYYNYYAALQRKKMETEFGAVKDANISVTQRPTPPAREMRKTPKVMAIAAVSGIALGLAWAFLRELYFDHSVKRAKDIESDLGMRLFLSIPDTQRNGHRRKAIADAKRAKKDKAETEGEAESEAPAANGAANGDGRLEIAPWDHHHSLHQHYEALRDRLISYFETNNLNHKPKLVAVTGSSKGSGTTTIAAGLAASLSETGDGNVLLIDMNMEQGAAQHFYKGKPNCELDTALEGNTMDKAMIQDNLYVVAGRTNSGDKLSSMLPKRFANLIPKLKASDYDYIIFDMPPISRTGVTQRLAGFMDMMMLVVEAEKTNRDVVRQANALLTESKAKVSVVLNKTRNYIPNRLHQEF